MRKKPLATVSDMSSGLKIIFVFVDGLGIGSDDPARNPLLNSRYPVLGKLISKATPVDACLGVNGKPQSATGQATLLTGVNAAQAMGRHIEGFPPARLKELVQQENIFSKLQQRGKQCTFANCYLNIDPAEIPLRRQSVTTVMPLSALGQVRNTADLLEGKAVTHDITRWTMYERGYRGELISPETAAGHLMTVGEANDFTLFEYFLTDRAGHSDEPEFVLECLDTLERFITSLTSFAEQPNRLLLLCSDHGNIEDNSSRTHTENPVPLISLGTGADSFRSTASLTDITPAILRLYEG